MSLTSRNEAFAEIQKLTARFARYESEYRANSYLESQVRLDFLDSFWSALGWDVRHINEVNPYRQEVRVEKSQTAEGGRKRPDYTFYLSPEFREAKFIVEAKRPGVGLTDLDPMLQAIKYGWNAGLQIVVLHNFAEFVVVDSRARPDARTAQQRIALRIPYGSLTDSTEFDKIYYLFSRASIAEGSLTRFAETLPSSKRTPSQIGLFHGGYRSIDLDFLNALEGWRDQLARALKNRNAWMDGPALTECTQRILDRLVLLRFLEDKGIEARISVASINEAGHSWSNFQKASRQLDSIYNGIVYKYHPLVDGAKLIVDDAAFSDICNQLESSVSDYDFAQIPIQILGSIYERFLGKIIVTTDKRARVEERPEVRKAGGVYYTPTHIVHHIVDATIKPMAEGKSFTELKKLHVIDTACGSGSFLIAAFDTLIQAAALWFNNNPAKAKLAGCIKTDSGGWRLSVKQKRELLVNCVYGIDLDHQAIEVAQLSLSLKLLEDETAGSAFEGQKEIEQALLPSMTYNIIWGNALIDTDYYEGDMFPDADLKLKPTNIKRTFADVFKSGGFDAVVGNPPYLFITELSDDEKAYFGRRYSTTEYRFDIYALFIERAITEIMVNGGRLGYIIPHTLLANDSFTKARKLFLEQSYISEVTDIGPGVFQGAKNETMVFVCEKSPPGRRKTAVTVTTAKTFPLPTKAFSIKQSEWLKNDKYAWLVNVDSDASAYIKRMELAPKKLGEYCTVNQGLRTGDNNTYLSDSKVGPLWEPVAGGADVQRYEELRKGKWVLYDTSLLDAPRRRELFDRAEKIVVQEIRNISLARRIVATIDRSSIFCLQSTNVIGLRANQDIDLRYLLAVINSEVMNRYFRLKFPANNHIASNQLASLPIPLAPTAVQKRLASLVESLVVSATAKAAAKAESQIKAYADRITALENQIEMVVCQLFGLPHE